MAIASINPATEEVLERFEPLTPAAIEAKLAASAAAFAEQRALSFADRSRAMQRAAELLDAENLRFATLLTEEMGKTLASARAEVSKCALACRHYADHAQAMLADEVVPTEAQRSLKRYLPLGPVLAVMPWNFPFWQVFRFAAPALMAGNTGLLKHASNVPRSALAIEEIFQRAGFPEGAFSTLLIGAGQVEAVLRDDRVRAATLTGSGPAGAAVAAVAGSEIKKTVLELGGSDPFIVMPSADISAAVQTAVVARTQNNGQSCIAAKRFIVHDAVYEEFREAFVAGFEALVVGDPMQESTDIGPLATRDGVTDVAQLVDVLERSGARRLTGAAAMDGTGYYYRPGIVEVPRDAGNAFDEEIFGPVALLYRAGSVEEAVALGNASPFGLGSAIYTQDESDMNYAFDHLDAGATFVNSMVASHPKLPFGGVKTSGFGRELAAEGIREFTNLKTLYQA